MSEKKRLFFGWEIEAPWPEQLPKGRLLDEAHRHLTVAFLGAIDYLKLKELLFDFPALPWSVGLTGIFDHCLSLPERHPHVVAWHIQWDEEQNLVDAFYKQTVQWLKNRDIHVDARAQFLPHVTLARSPFHTKEWLKSFSPLPCFIKDLCLYESLGNLRYEPLWRVSILSPFEEIEHTADRAYLIRGQNYLQLYQHGACALSFSFPELLPFVQKRKKMDSLTEVIIALNQIITQADQTIGCPFKALSYHSDLTNDAHGMIWEMIIDV